MTRDHQEAGPSRDHTVRRPLEGAPVGAPVGASEAARGLNRAVAGTVFLGLGLGGFVDGIVLHQILQWHHMLTSAGFPTTTVGNLEVNTVADGLFHAATWVFTVAGLALLWGAARRRHVHWPAKLLWGGVLAGWGGFNVVEGLVDHQILGIHHVNETAPLDQWIWWDVGFLVWGAVMLYAGVILSRRGRKEVAEATDRR